MQSLMGSDWYTDSRIRSLENQVAKLESELYRIQLTQSSEKVEREVTFWFGLMLVSFIAIVIMLGGHWR